MGREAHGPRTFTPEFVEWVEEQRAKATAAASGEGVRDRLASEGAQAKFLAYVVPESWRLPDLPMEHVEHVGGHLTPADFDRCLYKVLFTRVRTHNPGPRGPRS